MVQYEASTGQGRSLRLRSRPGNLDQQRAAGGRSRAAEDGKQQLVLRGHVGAFAKLSTRDCREVAIRCHLQCHRTLLVEKSLGEDVHWIWCLILPVEHEGNYRLSGDSLTVTAPARVSQKCVSRRAARLHNR